MKVIDLSIEYFDLPGHLPGHFDLPGPKPYFVTILK